MPQDRPIRQAVPGWVYVMENDAFPGLVKIGCTTRPPAVRAAELSAATGVPTAFRVAAARPVSDCRAVEKAVHRMLDDVRVSQGREFFACPTPRAIAVMNAVADAYPGRREARPLQPMLRQVRALPSYGPLPPIKRRAWRPLYRPGRSRWTVAGIRLAIGLLCAAVSIATTVLRPDLSAMPQGHIRSTLSILERL